MQQPFLFGSSPVMWGHQRIGGTQLLPFLEIAVSIRPSRLCASLQSKSLRLRVWDCCRSCRNLGSLHRRGWKKRCFSLMFLPRLCSKDEALWTHLHPLCQFLCCSGIWAGSKNRRWAEWTLQWLLSLLSALCVVCFSYLAYSWQSER